MYTESREIPTAIMVEVADDSRRDPVALPLAMLAPMAPGGSPYEPLRAWFAATYTWQADGAGAWDIVPRIPAAPPASTTEALEDLFTDATRGYRHCFAPGNAHCLPGCMQVKEPAPLTGACCDPPSTYAPTEQVKAFGA